MEQDLSYQQQLGSQLNGRLEEIKLFLQSNNYKFTKYLGKGDFSVVVQATSLKTNKSVAVKILEKVSKENVAEFEKEKRILQKCKNENYIIQIVESIADEKLNQYALVTELCDCDLEKIMELNKFNFEQTLAIFYQLLKGLLVFQLQGIIHSDIKPANILYSRKKNQFLISDFGLSKTIQKPLSQAMNSSLGGNILYMAPEVWKKQKPYSIKVDTFSIGIILAQILSEKQLDMFQLFNLKQNSLKDTIPEFKNHDQQQFIDDILNRMANFDQNQRLEPVRLIQALNELEINEESLNNLVLPQAVQVQSQESNNEITLSKMSLNASQPEQKQAQLQEQMKEIQITKLGDLSKIVGYQIITIDLDGNSIKEAGASSIASALQECKNIHTLSLNLYYNSIKEAGASSIASALQECKNIHTLSLDISNNSIKEAGVSSIASALQQCKNIHTLSLNIEQNDISKDYGKKIEEALISSLQGQIEVKY